MGKPCVFICHHGKDTKTKIASVVNDYFKQAGMDTFIDYEMGLGKLQATEIGRHLEKAAAIVILASESFFKSEYCVWELHQANLYRKRKENGTFVLPVFFDISTEMYSALADSAIKATSAEGGWRHETLQKLMLESGPAETTESEGLSVRVKQEWHLSIREVKQLRGIEKYENYARLSEEIVRGVAEGIGYALPEHCKELPVAANSQFIGREKEMQLLEDKLNGSPQPSVCIWGMSGIGKSQLALHYAYQHWSKYNSILWVEGGTSLRDNFAKLAEKLGGVPKDKDGSVEDLVEAVRQRLEGSAGRTLLIFDDVDDPYELQSLLPAGEQCRILITTRYCGGHVELVNLELKSLEGEVAMRLASGGKIFQGWELEALEQIRHDVGDLTLALAIVAMIVRVEYPSRLQERLNKDNSWGPRARALGHKRANPDISSIFRAAFDTISREPHHNAMVKEVAVKVALVGGWYASSPIRSEVLRAAASKLSGTEVSPSTFIDAVDLLVQFCLATKSEGTASVTFHTLVQRYERLQDTTKEAARAVVTSLYHQPASAYIDTEHFLVAFNWILPTTLEGGQSNHLSVEIEDLQTMIRKLGCPTAKGLAYMSRFEEARRVVDLSSALNLDDTTTSFLLDAEASLLEKQGKYSEAEPMYRKALEIKSKALGEEHTSYAASLYNLAGLLEKQGKYSEVEPTYRRALEIMSKAPGEEHPSYAVSLHALAGLLERQGKYLEAEPMFRRALEIKSKALGEEHPSYAVSLHALACLLEKQGKLKEAEEEYRKAHEIYRKTLGEEHTEYAVNLGALAGLLEKQDNLAEAEPMYRRALEIKSKALGEEHASYGASLHNLAGLLEKQGKLMEAEPMYRRAVAIDRTALGEEHTSYAASLHNLAGLLEKQGKLAEAEPMYRRALEIYKTALGEQHTSYTASLGALAGLLMKQAVGMQKVPKYEEAEKLYRKAMESVGIREGKTSASYAASLHNLAHVLERQHRGHEAEEFFREALKIKRNVLGEDHMSYADSLKEFALVQARRSTLTNIEKRKRGMLEEAESMYRQVLKIVGNTLGKEHMQYAVTLGDLQGVLEMQDKAEEAKLMSMQALQIQIKTLMGQGASNT